MPNDRPEDQSDEIINLYDLIEAREERTSAFADDIDGVEDVRRTDVDVDDALVFPHNHKRESKAPDIDLLDTPHEEDVGFDYQDSSEEMLPSDYGEPYADAISTSIDDEEIVVEENLEDLGEMTPDDLLYDVQVIDIPDEGVPSEMDASLT